MVYINTLLIQEVLREPAWANRLTPDDLRALTPLIYSHVKSLWRFSARPLENQCTILGKIYARVNIYFYFFVQTLGMNTNPRQN